MQPGGGIAAFFTVLLLTCSVAAGNDLRSAQDLSQNKRSGSVSSDEDGGAYSLSGFILIEDAKGDSTQPNSTVEERKDVETTQSTINASTQRLPGKVGHIDVVNSVNTSYIKEIKKKKIEAASVAMPMASFALGGTKEVEKKVPKPFPGNATQKAAFEKREKAVENQLAALKGRFKAVARVVNSNSPSGKVGHINVTMPVPAPVKLVPKNLPVTEKVELINVSVPAPVAGKVGHIKVKHLAPMEGKVGHIKVVSVPAPVQHVAAKSLPVAEKDGNSSVLVADPSVDSKQVLQSSTNATVEAKAIIDLPMAGLAFDDPTTAPPKPKFPGNSTQQAAFESKAESLEDQVASLKARLSNASESLIPVNLHPAAKATGTFHANVQHKDGDLSNTFMAAKAPEPMQPIIDYKDKKQKAAWPTMASVAAPVAKHVKKVALTSSGSKEDKRIYMGTAFTGTPAKKVESILALESAVQHGAVNIEGDDTEQAAPVNHVPGWLSSLSSWFAGSESPPPDPAAPNTRAVSLLATPRAAKPFAWTKQDRERTEQATLDDSQHNSFDVTSSWSQLEKQDDVDERVVRAQDVAERQMAETAELPHKPSKTELDAKKSVPMSGFWRGLEKEDNNIQDTVGSDDLVKYAELTHAQDVRVAQANDMLSDAKLTTNQKIRENRDARIAIHEPWLAREKQDKSIDRSIHDDPYLQMLQVGHRHRHLHH